MKKITIASVLLFFNLLNAESISQLKPTYFDNGLKNIAFFSVFGGSSHSLWVLDIGNELGRRGHNITYLTSEEQARFGKSFEYVKTLTIGPSYYNMKEVGDSSFIRNFSTIEFMAYASDIIVKNFERDYQFTRDYFISHKIDVAICDHFGETCVDAATSLNIPYIITSSMELTKDSFSLDSDTPYTHNDVVSLIQPTTEFESLTIRFIDEFIKPLEFIITIAIGIDAKIQDPSSKWKHALKMVNNIHGFSPARPMGPLVELVGPILPKRFTPLTEHLENYLDAHKRIAYIAFGQMATPCENDIRLILTSVLESIELGYFDLFPDTITISSGAVYHIQAMLNQTHPDARMVSWAPQTAILMHPSTHVFFSHGGLGSWYESMYAGKRMIMFPFFGDQASNSHMIEQSGLGAVLDYGATTEQAVDLIKGVALDINGEITGNVKRTQALVQIRSERSISRGADTVEEVAYTHKNGMLPHRMSANHRISFIKAHNLDIYSILILCISLFKAIGLFQDLK
ncbi:uncharacterized protein B0P05DRAFT_604795 [Gilbertella persicaria]|uniref:uncharacterized protein n=1 Tax=Gilbertella persicaria TaxID=101096 RepID=UPI00221E38CE|nr:uncharacterized protein B0P05DRAFT_604795 [Gilbertella persicaria]KAI8073485.1 hypothetical protein B0P05DRAFT_604795 [Gilbertella persicaria]